MATFEDYAQSDSRLVKVDNLAKVLYEVGGASLHNYVHACWDTDMIIMIGEGERHTNVPIKIAAARMHDTGVARGLYKFHAENGAKNVRDFFSQIGYGLEEVEEIATAVAEHNSWDHSNETSRDLFDADTLNKAGNHGIRQCNLVGEEFGLDPAGMCARWIPYFEKLATKGYYSPTAQAIDRSMAGGQYGLKRTLDFFVRVDEMLRQGCAPGNVLDEARKQFGIR